MKDKRFRQLAKNIMPFSEKELETYNMDEVRAISVYFGNSMIMYDRKRDVILFYKDEDSGVAELIDGTIVEAVDRIIELIRNSDKPELLEGIE